MSFEQAEQLGDELIEEEQEEEQETEQDPDEESQEETEEEGQEEEESEEEAEEKAEEEEEENYVEVAGEKVPFDELKNGYLRQEDYSLKIESFEKDKSDFQEIKSQYQAQLEQTNIVYNNLIAFIEELIQPEPSISLIAQDPKEYETQVAARQQAIKELQSIIQSKQQFEQQASSLSNVEYDRYVKTEQKALLNVFPELSDPAKKLEFDRLTQKTAAEFGFSQEEIESTVDHKVLQLVHYARLGKIAENNRKNIGKKASESPRKGTKSKKLSVSTSSQKKAMQRLAKTGRIEDALQINF